MDTRTFPEAPAVHQDIRPWGKFRQYALNACCTVKVITVDPGGVLSLQRHEHRDELWVVLDPGLVVQIGDDQLTPAPGEEFFIPRGTLHRLSSPQLGGRIVEVAFGEFDEQDIQRLDDLYQR